MRIADEILAKQLLQRQSGGGISSAGGFHAEPRPHTSVVEWSQESKLSNGSGCRLSHTNAVYRGRLYLIGGMMECSQQGEWGAKTSQQLACSEEMLVYDLVKSHWMKPRPVRCADPERPYGRYAHASALIGSRVYVFGGHRVSSKSGKKSQDTTALLLNDLAYINLANVEVQDTVEFVNLDLSQRAVQEAPSPRSAQAYEVVTLRMISVLGNEAYRQQLWIFGGSNLKEFYNDMYYFDFTEMCWHQVHYDMTRSLAVPTPRASHTLVYFPKQGVQGCFYMFGGGNFHQFFNDLFIFDIDSRAWHMPTVQGEAPPAARAGHTATKLDE
jgi:Galactose oxidase, central domain